MVADLVSQILEVLSSNDHIISSDAFPGVASSTIKGALDRLESRGMVTYQTVEREVANLTEEGKSIATDGSHEAKVFEAVNKAVEGLRISDLPVYIHGYAYPNL